MYSGEGEEVELLQPVRPSGNVENWLREVERSMKASLRDNIHRSLLAYPEVWKDDWTALGPGPSHQAFLPRIYYTLIYIYMYSIYYTLLYVYSLVTAVCCAFGAP